MIRPFRHPEHRKDEHGYGPTGRIEATVALRITIRDFGLLDQLGGLLAGAEPLSVEQVTWHADHDNPAWPQVRASAIAAAITKGRDYAAALGGSLQAVVHVADAGLLGGDESRFRVTSGTGAVMRRPYSASDAPSLDPELLELTAVIEARFTAAGVSLRRMAALAEDA